ncbi:phosphonate C-P lyase system protein PhnL [Paenibacillus lycopersici]|uniref:Phosphonate C-P lyase system protein PhnL n=1 Tax=Paenibacillus lycopersici TaxID=2704462 RepID=A0A6C0G0I0_9BACL|nr:phosphonate C-P lyase system protein PhnL [Paenibacillus lycopersici]QHT62928.1 phosphonate C-P lyase system protein PhnL [Paenibacillus lycopersici]
MRNRINLRAKEGIPILQVRQLGKQFDLRIARPMEVTPLLDVSFDIEQGRFLGIAGPSGVGKSTILKSIYRTYTPSSGSIVYQSELFGEIDLAAASERTITHLRKYEMGYVSQFLRVIPRVSATDVIAERLMSTGVEREEARMAARQMLERLNIDKKLWEGFPATFSGGEQQRINLGRAFIVRPRLMILDEPTASLDRRTTEAVIELLQDMKRQGTTMIGVFHDWEVMERLSDHILVMDGKGSGQVRDVLAASASRKAEGGTVHV